MIAASQASTHAMIKERSNQTRGLTAHLKKQLAYVDPGVTLRQAKRNKGKKSEQERQRLYNVGKQTSWNQLNLVTKQTNEELNKEKNIDT